MNATITDDRVNSYSSDIASIMGDFLKGLDSSGFLQASCGGFTSNSQQVLEQTCRGELFGCNNLSTDAQFETFCALMTTPDLGPEEQLTLMHGAGLNAASVRSAIQQAMEESIDETVDSLYPNEEYMVTVPFYVGMVFAVMTSLFLAVNYLPSITSTTLQLRTGVIPTLSEMKLNQYRAAVSCKWLLSRRNY